MNRGWFRLYRKIDENPLYFSEPFSKALAWIDILLLTAHKDSYFFIRGIRVDVKRGQFAYSQEALAKRWKWSRNKVIRFLNSLEIRQQLVINSLSKTIQQKRAALSIYTVKNYDTYQSDDTTDDTTERHQTIQQKDIYNNDNNEKNEKEEQHTPATKISNKLSISRSQELTFLKAFPGMATTELREQIQACNTYMNMSSSNYTNPGLFFRGWLKRYIQERTAKHNEFSAAKKAQANLPNLSEEERQHNLERLAEMKKRLGVNK